jgi:hypothetical protein
MLEAMVRMGPIAPSQPNEAMARIASSRTSAISQKYFQDPSSTLT